MALSAGVHARPSLMPALHLLVVPQIGHGWISVLHVPPGQSAVVMQPKLAFEPPPHLLVALPWGEVFGIGNGGPKRHPDAVHWSSAQFALLQLPAVQVPPGVQSAPVVHGPAQSAVVVHVPPRFEVAPCVQRFPPASV